MKFATHILFYNQDKWILKNIEMIAPYVEKIYIAWSNKPWIYNRKARTDFKNNSNLDILKISPFYNKIQIIKGDWNYDEDERNACLDAAKKDNIDYLLIIDADEFYFKKDIENIIDDIKNNPDFDYYTTPWLCFWKSFKNVVQNKNNSIIGYPEIAINVKKDLKFKRCRIPTGKIKKQLNYLCFHASFVLTDKECWEKINTWGHSHQIKSDSWYKTKWLEWNEDTRYLHPAEFKEWYKTIKYKKELPEILKEYE